MDPERHDKQGITKFDLTHVEFHENSGKVVMRDQVEVQEDEEQEK